MVNSGFKTTVGLILLTVGFLATLGTILGFLGSFWWAFDALASFRVQYAAILLVCGLLYGLVLARGAALLFIVLALVNIGVVVPLYLRQPAAAASDAGLTLVSYNVESIGRRMPEVVTWLDQTTADIVFLLESSEDWEGPLRSSTFDVVNELPVDRRSGILVLSKMDADVSLMRLGRVREPVVRVETNVAGEDIVVYAVRVKAANTETAAVQHAEVLEELAEAASGELLPVVVMGDLGDTPWTHTFRQLAGDADLVNSLDGYGIQPSWPAQMPFGLNLPLDHMLHSRELTTMARATGPNLGADHLPLLVTVGLAG
jgi:endonuclease/exonuclease/phosphatase (EEP) superfamily protein YafD